jgi:hypothetical protein
MRTFGSKDVQAIIDKLSLKNENLEQDVSIGTGKNKKVVVKDGLKIRHVPTGLVYTVIEYIDDVQEDPQIRCSRPGKEIVISSDKFNEYVRH